MTFKEVIIGIDRPLSKLHSLWRHSYFSSAVCASFLKFFLKHNYHHSGFYCGQQCSWTLTPANSMQDSIMQSDDRNRKKLGLRQAFNLPRLRSLGWMGEQIRCQHILVSCFTCTHHGDLVWLLSPPLSAHQLQSYILTKFDRSLYTQVSNFAENILTKTSLYF